MSFLWVWTHCPLPLDYMSLFGKDVSNRVRFHIPCLLDPYWTDSSYHDFLPDYTIVSACRVLYVYGLENSDGRPHTGLPHISLPEKELNYSSFVKYSTKHLGHRYQGAP